MKKIVLLVFTCLIAANAYAAWDPNEDAELTKAVEQTIAKLKETDPTVQTFFDKAYGYAVFPKITKGGLVVGGSHGKGQVYKGGKIVGNAKLSSASFGLQAGGQQFAEIIFFQDEETMTRLKENKFQFSAKASAVAATSGAAASTTWSNGVATFIMAEGGLMAEAALGSQKFTYEPLGES